MDYINGQESQRRQFVRYVGYLSAKN